jgi:hypothetical protein
VSRSDSGGSDKWQSISLPERTAGRALSLWDLMNDFNLWDFGNIIAELEHFVALLSKLVRDGDGSERNPEFYRTAMVAIDRVLAYAKAQRFQRCHATVLAAESHLRLVDKNADISTLAAEVRHTRDALMNEIYDRKFLRVDLERASYVDHAHLLGDKVAKAFYSAIPDIREVGNCLAADCNTAAVFHMMRVVEWGLRSLCVSLGFRRLKAKFKKTGTVSYIPIEYSEWEKILNQLQERVDAKIAKVKRGLLKQQYQEFYYPILQDIRGIRDAWRNHVMHTRREYTAKDADGILEHVRRLMNTLATQVHKV